jgi:hypothetical protein
MTANPQASSSPLDAALSYLRAGLSVIPIRPEGSKRPSVLTWQRYQQQLPSEDEACRWWNDGTKGIAIISGAVSGNLECIDFDSGELFAPWCELVEAQVPGLVSRLCVVKTPRPGFHVRYRCSAIAVPGNSKLAVEPVIDHDTGKHRLESLIETRGEGGYALAHGSPPACHSTGRTYDHVGGPSLTELRDITPEERDILIAAARSFDLAAAADFQDGPQPGREAEGSERPGDAYNARGPDWQEILVPHGWEAVRRSGPVTYWRRPGKAGKSWSATTGYCASQNGHDLLAVFSSNADPFEGPTGTRPCSCYTKFAAFALLNHAGDFAAAARDLAEKGFGDQQENENEEGPNPLDRLAEVLAAGPEALFRDSALLRALAYLAENTPAEFACVRAQVQRAGVKVRDFDRALAPLRSEIRATRPLLDAAGSYRVLAGQIVHRRLTPQGSVTVLLANWSGRIVEEVVHDDGAERSITLAVEGALADGTPLPRVTVSAAEFPSMRWPVQHWGTRAVVLAGAGTADHLRVALQLLSGDVPRRLIYGHTGWREVDGRWVYLHAGGAIGADGPVNDVVVSLPPALAGYILPAPSDGAELADAVRASLRILNVAPDRITVPLLGTAYRAVLASADYTLHLAGPTGAGKTELAALAQQHHGAGLDARHLPGSWSSTGNSLEGLAFVAKEALLAVDDFAPGGGTADVARQHREADRLLRAQGNRSGRGRMGADGTLRPAKPPRGTILSTGEDVPRGQSCRARLLTLELAPGDLNWSNLTACQRDAAAGLYAAALASYVLWLARNYPTVRDGLPAETAALRERLQTGGMHARTPGILADLAAGWRCWLDFAQEVGAITAPGRAVLDLRVWTALVAAGSAQAEHVQATDPTAIFLRLLAGALASGRAHVAGANGAKPKDPGAWGWRSVLTRAGPEWQPQGLRVGWLEGTDLFLEPEASFAAAQELARDQAEALPVTPRTLLKRLRERELLASTEADKLTTRRTLEGKRRCVIHLAASTLYPAGPGEPGQPGEGAVKPRNSGPGSCPGSSGRTIKPGEQTGQETQGNRDSAPGPPVPPGNGTIEGGPAQNSQNQEPQEVEEDWQARDPDPPGGEPPRSTGSLFGEGLAQVHRDVMARVAGEVQEAP